jgi:hypothetical protein
MPPPVRARTVAALAVACVGEGRCYHVVFWCMSGQLLLLYAVLLWYCDCGTAIGSAHKHGIIISWKHGGYYSSDLLK